MNENEQEIEVKFYVNDLAAVEESLLGLGCRLVEPKVFESNLRFDTPDGALTLERRVLRLRQPAPSGQPEAAGVLTYQSPAQPGQEVTIRELLERILKIVGRDVRVRVDDQRLRPENSEVMRLLSNNQKARQRLHWQPEVSLEDGLEQTVAWIRQHQSLYRPGVYEF